MADFGSPSGSSEVASSEASSRSTTFDAHQIKALEHYYNHIKMKPVRAEKTELALKYNIDPVELNKWFQARRNKDKNKKRKSDKLTVMKKQQTKSNVENAPNWYSIKDTNIRYTYYLLPFDTNTDNE